MPKVLNSDLPSGARGLWWFPQGLENLGTGATGDAILGGSAALSGGQLVHSTTGDSTELTGGASGLTLWPTSTEGTMMMSVTAADTTLRGNGLIGFTWPFLPNTARIGVHLYWTDSKTYFDVAGADEGTTRLSVSTTKDTDPHIWAFTFGGRGMEIWQDDVLLASNAATPTLDGDISNPPYYLGRHAGSASDLIAYDWVLIHGDQLSTTLLSDIFADPEGELTEEAGGVAPITRGAIAAGRIARGLIAR